MSASKVAFYVEGGDDLGDYLMYNVPAEGDVVSFGDGDDYKVTKRVIVVRDNMVRVTVKRYDSA